MARQVLSAKDIDELKKESTSERQGSDLIFPVSRDSYFDRLFKYIPAEIVAGYIFIAGSVKQLTEPVESKIFTWIIFFLFCILTPLYLWRVQKVLKLQQHIISLISFIVWIFALGGPFLSFSWYNPVYGSIILPVFTLLIAIWEAE